MEQKSYKMKLITLLIAQKKHGRALAKELKTNHMTIMRALQALQNENVIDYTLEGKNKVFSIKKSVEARLHSYMAEQYMLTQFLKKYPSFRRILEEIQHTHTIPLAILFGSYAKGYATKQSDIDIYIETTNKQLKKRIEDIDSRIHVTIGKYNKKNLMMQEIEKGHIILKGVEKFYEKNKFFE